MCRLYTTVSSIEKKYIISLSFSILNFITGLTDYSFNKEVVLKFMGFLVNLIFSPIPAEKTKGI